MLAFFLSPLGRKLGMAVGAVILLYAAYRYAYDKGNSEGLQSGKLEQLELDKKAFEQDRAQFITQLQDLQKKADAAESRAQVSLSAAAGLQQAISKIPRSIPQNSTAPPADDASKLADYNALFAENEKRKELEVEQGRTISALQEQIAALKQQRDVAVDFGNKMVVHYQAAYSAAQKHHSRFMKIISFGLIRDRKMNLTAPATLHP